MTKKYKTNIRNKISNFFFESYAKFVSCNFQLNFKNISKNYIEEKKTYNKLKDNFKKDKIFLKSQKRKLKIYVPGGGNDITTLLLILDTISDKSIDLEVVFQEIRDYSDGLIEELKKNTKKPVIFLRKTNKKIIVKAIYKNKKIKVIYYLYPVEDFFPIELKKGYDIYYERAFELFRSNSNEFFYNCKKFLNESGIMISDYGFKFNKNDLKNFKKLKNIPKAYGLYNNFEIWKKQH